MEAVSSIFLRETSVTRAVMLHYQEMMIDDDAKRPSVLLMIMLERTYGQSRIVVKEVKATLLFAS